jgi:hypothetical protein
LQESDFHKDLYPFWPQKKDEDVRESEESAALGQAMENLGKEEQATAFKKDTLALMTDQSDALKYASRTARTEKALRIAKASHIARSVQEGRALVVEPFMQKHCAIHVL